jgi:hypothetical protein
MAEKIETIISSSIYGEHAKETKNGKRGNLPEVWGS